MSSPQSGQVHMMVMPKCKEPAKAAASKTGGNTATPKKERVASKMDSKQESSGSTPNTKKQTAE